MTQVFRVVSRDLARISTQFSTFEILRERATGLLKARSVRSSSESVK